MKNNNYKVIGNGEIKIYQIFIIIFGILLCFIVLLNYIMESTTNNLILLFFTFFFILIFNYLYSKIFIVSVINHNFKIFNLFFTKIESACDYESVNVILRLPFVIKLKFKNGRNYLFMLNSKDSFLSLFSSEQKTLTKINKEIKKAINQ